MKSTTDLWFAAFLSMKGFTVIDFEVIGSRRGKWCFDLKDADWKELKLEFVQSPIAKCKQEQEKLKDMLF